MPGDEPAEGAAPVAVCGDDGVHVPAGLLQLRHRHRVQVVQDQALAVEVSMTFCDKSNNIRRSLNILFDESTYKANSISAFTLALKNLCQMGE